MTKISRFQPSPSHMNVFIDNFWNAVTLLDDKEQVKLFLSDLLTYTEITMFAKRIQIAKMLVEGEDYQSIISQVKVTPGTISHVNNILHTRGQGLRKVVKKILNFEEQKKELSEAKYKRIVPAGPYRAIPDLIEVGSKIAAQKIKQSKRRASIKQQSIV